MNNQIHAKCLAVLAQLCAGIVCGTVSAGTAFTYQGKLTESGTTPSFAEADFIFRVFDSVTTGTQVGADFETYLVGPIAVDDNGAFVVDLDFGSGVFTGGDRWLEIEVRAHDPGNTQSYTLLAPRQPIMPVPYAFFAAQVPWAQQSPGLVELSVDGNTGLRLESAEYDYGYGEGPGFSPNIIVGSPSNAVTPGVAGAAISGGGYYAPPGWNQPNVVTDNWGVVGGGVANRAGNGTGATDDAMFATVGGGSGNIASRRGATIGGGAGNDATNEFATIGGGQTNLASHIRATVAGGYGNTASGQSSFVGGGRDNTASGLWSTVPGGHLSVAAGANSFAAGKRAKANHDGAVVFGDSTDSDFASTAADQFLIRATGGVGISTNSTTHQLTIASTASDDALRLIGPDGVDGYGARLNFGDANLVYLDEDTDDHLTIFANQGASILGGFVGIGTTLPSARLHAVGGVDASLAGGGFLVLGTTTSSNMSIDNNEIMARNNGAESTLYLNNDGGDVRIGNASGGTSMLYTPVLTITGGSDLSEKFDVSARFEEAKPGMVVCIDPNDPGKLAVSTSAYDRKVAGIISGAGGVNPGMIMGQDGSLASGEHPVALTGRVYVLVEASDDAIEPGDLLTTSDVPGYAMKVRDFKRAHGAIIGKAMTPMDSGERGLVLVLVSLH